jgi:hypothetical protein
MERSNDPDNHREGFSYILTKRGMERASSDVGLMLIAYNFRRIVNILTADRLKEYLRILLSLFLTISDLMQDNLKHFGSICSQNLVAKEIFVLHLYLLKKGLFIQPGAGF